MISGLDHLIILANDLEQATRDYEQLGFRVTPGGEHADGLTRNALIPFRDGSYLEIVAFLDPDHLRDNVWGWRRFAATGGLMDHCLASDDLASDVERMREAGFRVEGPDDGARRLPDGGEIRWRQHPALLPDAAVPDRRPPPKGKPRPRRKGCESSERGNRCIRSGDLGP